MQHTEDHRKLELVSEAAALAAASGANGEAAAVDRFVREFYHHVAAEDVARSLPSELAEAALSMWRFAQERLPFQPLIRVLSLAAQGGAESCVVQIVNDDMGFLVDSVGAALAGLGFEIELVIHPVLAVRRDEAGRMLDFGRTETEGHAESMMHVELVGDIDAERRTAVIGRLQSVLADLRAATEDGPAMRSQVLDLADLLADSPEGQEEAAFLRWLDDGNILLLGAREYSLRGSDLAVVPGVGLGLLRDDEFLVFDGLRALTRSSPDVQDFLRGPQLTMISKSNRRSPIHRPAPMDTVLVKQFDAAGEVTGLRLIIGLFTADSYFRPPHEIPILRRKVQACRQRSGFAADSRDGRALQHILDTFPRDELFQIDEDQLFDTAMGVLHLKQRPRVSLFVLRDPFERFATCLTYLPRDRYNAEAGRRIAAILQQAFSGSISFEATHFDDAVLARLHTVIALPPGPHAEVSVPEIERRLTEALRTWADRLHESLTRLQGERGPERLRRYGTAFPPGYIDRFPVGTAVADMGFIDAVLAGAAIAVTLTRDGARDSDSALRLKTFHPDTPVALSDVLPMLENLGARVVNEIPFAITPRDAVNPVWIQEFELLAPIRATAHDDTMPDRFEEAFRQVWAGTLESDGFNRLVLTAGLSAREVVVLRAYCKLLRQAGSGFSQAYMEDTASAHPHVARLLVTLFEQRSNPARDAVARTALATQTRTEILEALEQVENLDEDRILRSFLLLIDKTLRTNFFQRDAEGRAKPYLSIKIASREVELLPQPRPLVEIFVYSPRMEGCHLRGGKVARGGIRWSDRKEDFRTEVLGLMKAQMVKNAVIVPIGSKGGFVVKRPPEGGREALMAEVVECYRTLMRGLLDLTDNIVGAEVVPPPEVVRHDADDTYLVVAADKGTATFSDIANGIALDYGFWLGDAFASGGSIGYDHKVMGITAKGAWEAVKRHFREIGTDIQASDFSCIGVGDMSGDVFGNGMLLSHHTRLVAAFNHQHIFIDPDPDPARSWTERKRLFDLPRSSWRDYDAASLSEGGGIYDRSAKSITLSPQACVRFGLTQEPLSPARLIQALLCQDVDLLWFGGIGTYVKASGETQADAGDRANDALRIDAPSLQAKVVGEGANLAITQRGRIEAALHGIRLNTDAIDNSAGVDTSDHEVNIKIGVGDVIAAGQIAAKDRAAFLASMTDDVERLVLEDNYLQTLALSLAEARAPALLDSQAGLMRALERKGRLDRDVEFLPDDAAIARRAQARRGLTRPEVAVLLAYAKNALYDALLESDLPDVPELQAELLAYFPERLRHLGASVLPRHRLHRNIIATSLANAILNRMGPSFVEDAQSRTGRDEAAVARAYVIVRDVFGLPSIWRFIEALDGEVPAAAQTRLFLAVATVVEQAVRWFLQSGLDLQPAARVAQFKPGVDTLAASLTELLPERQRQVLAARLSAHVEAGAPAGLAARINVINTLSTAMDIVQISEEGGGTGSTGGTVTDVARTYFAVGNDLGLLDLRRQARLMPAATRWQSLAADALVDDSFVQQREITRRLTANGAGEDLADWFARRAGPGTQLREVLAEIDRAPQPDLAMLTVAARRIRAVTA